MLYNSRHEAKRLAGPRPGPVDALVYPRFSGIATSCGCRGDKCAKSRHRPNRIPTMAERPIAPDRALDRRMSVRRAA